MQKKGFTLIELMVVITIMGILSAIAVPKLFGQTAKAKAAEVTPAAMAYITLQKAYLMEKQKIGTWKRIGYSAPKDGNFRYDNGGEIKRVIPKKKIMEELSGNGKPGWRAENTVGLDGCHSGNQWVVSIVALSETNASFRTEIVRSATSSFCQTFTKDFGKSF